MSHDTVVHRVVRPVVRRLARTRVSPDQLTALRLATALAAAAAFAVGQPAWLVVGSVVFLMSSLLDRADGELARQTGRFSRHGHRYDLVADCSATAVVFVGIGIGAWDGPLGWWAIVLGALAAVGVTVLFWQINVRATATLPGLDVQGRTLLDPDDAMFALPFLLWCGGPELVLLPAGLITPALAAWMVLRHPGWQDARGTKTRAAECRDRMR